MQKVVTFTQVHTWDKNVGRVRLRGWGNAYIYGCPLPIAKRETRNGWVLKSHFRNRFSKSDIRVGYICNKPNPLPHCICKYVGKGISHHGYYFIRKYKSKMGCIDKNNCGEMWRNVCGCVLLGKPNNPPSSPLPFPHLQ